MKKTKHFSIAIIIIMGFIMASCSGSTPSSAVSSSQTPLSSLFSAPITTATTVISQSPVPSSHREEQNSDTVPSGTIEVSFIDVGQADSILIKANGASMLIDAGNNSDGVNIVAYIRSQGISKLDYLIGTHPHEDHIGGMDDIINAFDIDKIIMPKVSNTTKTYEAVLTAVSSKGLKITAPIPSTLYSFGNASFTILAPNSSNYIDLNNYSVVLKLLFGKTSFMFDGDAEDVSESEMLGKGYDLKSDVLKVGHHGSTSSTTTSFLNAVNPSYAVISVGSYNTYGHPAPSTLNKLNNSGVQVFRTDESGTIVATSDGNTIKFDKNASPIKQQAPPSVSENDKRSYSDSKPVNNQYVGNKNSKKFHRPSCSSLPADYNRLFFNTREEAANEGYVPCKICKP